MADPIRQDEIDQMLRQAQAGAPPAGAPAGEANPAAPSGVFDQAATGPQAGAAKPPAPGPESGMASSDIETLLRQAEQALQSVDQPVGGPPPGVKPFRLEEFGNVTASDEVATLELLRDVELDLKIELGRTHLYLEDVLKLRKGSVVPLDKLAGDPVDIYVNGRLIARGEVLVLNDNFCVRVAELVAGEPAATG
jgi:flagellar motor switch protein FliN/FliY